MTKGALVYFRRSFGFPHDYDEVQAAFFALDKSGTTPFFGFAKQDSFAMTHWTLVSLCFAVHVLLDEQ